MAMSSRSAKDSYRPDTIGAREGFTPPACRNHRTPTADDTPISSAASSERAPCAIAAQNWTRSCRQATVGRPGDGICPRYSCTTRCRSRIVAINTSIDKVLRRPAESTQYTSFRYTSRLAEVGVMPSIGSVADSFDNAMAESLIGTLKAELINRRSWRTREEVEFAVVEWVAWYNTRRLHSSIGDIPPAEFEADYAASTDTLQPTGAT
jgi:transposase InsO family protein